MMSNLVFPNNKIFRFYLLPLLIIVLLTSSCKTKKSVSINDQLIKISQPRVFNNTFKNALYKTDMKLYERELSGLMFFKKMDTTMRVVMLSEVGLKYFDIEYLKGDQSKFIVHHIIDFLDHEPVTKSLEEFLQLLVIDFPNSKKDNTSECQPGYMLRVLKEEGKNNRYYYNSNSGAVQEIVQSGFLKKKTTILLSDYNHLAPGNIIFHQGKINFKLTKVEKN